MLSLEIAKKEKWLIIFILAITFIYSAYIWLAPHNRFNTPDEVVNSFFSERLANGENLRAPAPLNKIAGETIVRPRWVHILDNDIVLAGFIGFPLILAIFGWVFSVSVLPFITPIFAIFGLGALYLLGRDLINRRAAWLIIILTSVTPAYWYYHSRSFFHNALFFDLVLVGMWLWYQALKKQKIIWYLLTGLILGLAISVRSSEVFWLATAFGVWSAYCYKQIIWRYIAWLVLGLILGIAPVLVVNYLTYGQLFIVGYSGGITLPAAGGESITKFISQVILPFGFHPRVMWQIFLHYIVQFSWWWFILVLVGTGYVIKKWQTLSQEVKGLFLMSLVVSAWLLVVYGSWWFSDNPDPTAVTLGSSYVRYFLPLYILGLWPASFYLADLWLKKYGRIIVSSIIIIFITLSANLVLWGKDEGLVFLQQRLWQFENVSRVVQGITPSDSVIVAPGRTDKFFWPERQVIVSFASIREYQAVGRLVKAGIPVYLFNLTFSEVQLVEWQNKLKIADLELKLEKDNLLEHSLYKFLQVNTP